MSGARDSFLVEAYRLMRHRGITTTTLAAEVKTSRAFVSRVLCNYERHGGTWLRVRTALAEHADIVALLDRVPVRPRSATYFRRVARIDFPAAVAMTQGSTSVEGLTEVASHTPPAPRETTPNGKAAGAHERAAGNSISLSEVAARFCNWRNHQHGQQRSA